MATAIEPDELMGILADYQSRIVPIIQRHRGIIDKFMGDGIMATFGAAVTTESYAADALRAVDDIMIAAETWKRECLAKNKPALRVSGAVTTGRIIFGAVGNANRLEYTVIGKAVYLSAKLEKHTKKEGVRALCTVNAYEKAIAQGYQAPPQQLNLLGRKVEDLREPIDVVVIAS